MNVEAEKVRSPARAARPPRVRELPVIGSAFELMRDPLGFLDRITREHGDAVEFRIPGQKIYLFNHPDAIEQVLVTERDRLIKDKLTQELSLMLGNGLLVSEGTFWRKQRKLAQPGFHRERIAAYGDVMVRFAERAIESWHDGESRDVHVDMMRLTLDIVAKTLFGVEIAEVARKIELSLETLMDRFSGAGTVIPIGLPLPSNFRTKRAIEQLDEIVYGIIRERRKGGDNGDLVSMLIAATSDEDPASAASGDDCRSSRSARTGGMDDKQLRDESMTLLLAGHETTALTLGFCFHLLAQHPDAALRLEREIDDVLGDRPATAADMPKLRWAEAIVRESMRLYPPAWALGRQAIAPCTIGGYSIEPGTQLWVAQWTVHRDARWFPEPERFLPDRWMTDLAKTLPRQAYFPFGGGPRICIGNAFAMMEAVLVLVTIARRFRVSPAPDAKPMVLAPSVTLRPKHGVRVTCTARKESSAQ